MRRKHHYTIVKIIHEWGGDYFDFEDHTKIERVIFTTNKRAKAENFYESHLYEENGTEYKGIYYPNVEILFVRDY